MFFGPEGCVPCPTVLPVHRVVMYAIQSEWGGVGFDSFDDQKMSEKVVGRFHIQDK